MGANQRPAMLRHISSVTCKLFFSGPSIVPLILAADDQVSSDLPHESSPEHCSPMACARSTPAHTSTPVLPSSDGSLWGAQSTESRHVPIWAFTSVTSLLPPSAAGVGSLEYDSSACAGGQWTSQVHRYNGESASTIKSPNNKRGAAST